jgi:hypothetical protein
MSMSESLDFIDDDPNPNPNPNNDADACPQIVVHDVIKLMASMMNYLSVSLYEGSFKQCHQEALAVLNSIYNAVSKTPHVAPSINNAVLFYNNFVFLSKVMDTDDPDYGKFRRELFRYVYPTM